MNATNQTRNFFNLHATGVGYLSRVRWVNVQGKGRKSEPFLACSIAALRGDAEAVDYTYFDLRVSGEEAIRLIDRASEDVEANRKVLVTFKIGDLYAHAYERDVKVDGRKTGDVEMAALIKGRLLFINSIFVDGEQVYKAEKRDPTTGDQGSAEDDQDEGFEPHPQEASQEDSLDDETGDQTPRYASQNDDLPGDGVDADAGLPQGQPAKRRAPRPEVAAQPRSLPHKAGVAVGRAVRQVRAAVAA